MARKRMARRLTTGYGLWTFDNRIKELIGELDKSKSRWKLTEREARQIADRLNMVSHLVAKAALRIAEEEEDARSTVD